MSRPVLLNGLVKTHSHSDSNLGRSHFPRKANSGSRDTSLGLGFLDQITPWLPRGLQMTNQRKAFLSWKKNKQNMQDVYISNSSSMCVCVHTHMHARTHTHPHTPHRREYTLFNKCWQSRCFLCMRPHVTMGSHLEQCGRREHKAPKPLCFLGACPSSLE